MHASIGESERLIFIFGCISYGLDSKLMWCDGERTGYYPVTGALLMWCDGERTGYYPVTGSRCSAIGSRKRRNACPNRGS